jgi:hypothetical protein
VEQDNLPTANGRSARMSIGTSTPVRDGTAWQRRFAAESHSLVR